MKNLLSVLLLLIGTSSAFAQASEEEAIKRIIQQETDTYWAGNYDQWANTWAHEPYVLWIINQADGGYHKLNGWEQVSTTLKLLISNRRDQPTKTLNEDPKYSILQKGSLAFVTYNRVSTNTVGVVSHTYETRVLEKKGNDWKFIHFSAFYPWNEPRTKITGTPNQEFKKGTYSVMLNAAMPPQKFTFADDGKYTVSMNGMVGVEGSYKIAGDTLEITDKSGLMSCKGPSGRYRWRQDGKSLSFIKIDDLCAGRINSFTKQPWTQE